MNFWQAVWRGIWRNGLPPPTHDHPAVIEARRAETQIRRTSIIIAGNLRRNELAKLQQHLARSARQ